MTKRNVLLFSLNLYNWIFVEVSKTELKEWYLYISAKKQTIENTRWLLKYGCKIRRYFLFAWRNTFLITPDDASFSSSTP